MDAESRRRGLLQALTPPWLLRPGGDAVLDEVNNDAAVWIDSTVPTALKELHALAADLNANLHAAAAVTVAAARYWSPAVVHSVLGGDEDAEAVRGGLDAWTTPANLAAAEAVIDRLCAGNDDRARELAVHLLQHYIRPLFARAAGTSASIDAATGRARRPDPLLTALAPSQALGEDEPLWKGTAAHVDDFEVLGSPLTFDLNLNGSDSPDSLRSRNAAIGCWNVLAWCLSQIARVQSQSSTTAWEQHWPLILPPLLTLLEDTDPHFRLFGARILINPVLVPSIDGGHGVPPQLLVRTNVVPLFMRALETSYTFISSGRAHILLDAALGAAHKLVILTTSPVATVSSRQQGNTAPTKAHSFIIQDHGLARLDGLSRIMTEGIFKVWSFPVRATAGPRSSQRHELVRTTFRWLCILASGEASFGSTELDASNSLGIASSRFLGIVCEFVGSWVEREWAGAWALHAPSPQAGRDVHSIPADLGLSLARQRSAASLLASAEAIFQGTNALVRAAGSASSLQEDVAKLQSRLDLPPGIDAWAGRVLLATARLWTLLHDAGLLRNDLGSARDEGPIAPAVLGARTACQNLWQTYDAIDPRISRQFRDRLAKLDAGVFADLYQ